MAWTAPMTFVDGVPLTASQLNTHLRDNMLESATAKASIAGGYFVSTGPNEIVERISRYQLINASDTSSSTSFDDLDSSSGPRVTVTTGSAALVIVGCTLSASSGANTQTRMGYEVSGASSFTAEDSRALRNTGTSAFTGSFVEYRTDLTPGVNTFTAKYRVNANTGTFAQRRVIVFPR